MSEVSAIGEGFLRASSTDEGGEVIWFGAPWLVSTVPPGSLQGSMTGLVTRSLQIPCLGC
jgi:hypothetical protein